MSRSAVFPCFVQSIVHPRAIDHFAWLSFAGTNAMQLEIYGGEYEITGLDPGSQYFVRVFAKNQMVGWGAASSTTPGSMVPSGTPGAPGIVEAAASGPNDLVVTWSGVSSSSSSSSRYRTVETCIIHLSHLGLACSGSAVPRFYPPPEPIRASDRCRLLKAAMKLLPLRPSLE